MQTDKELIEIDRLCEFLSMEWDAKRQAFVDDEGHIIGLKLARKLAQPTKAAFRLEAISSGEAVAAVRRVLEIADQRHTRELEADPFDAGFIALKHFTDAVRVALRDHLPAPSPMPSREEVERALAAKLEEVGGSYLSIDQAADVFFSSSLGGGEEEEGTASRVTDSGRGALPTPPEKPGHSEWFKLDVDPEVGRKFIALYSDGSGAAMFWRHDEGVIDQDGDDSAWPLTKSYDRWAYLPDNLEFWCETGEEPMTLRLPQHSDGGRG